MRECPHCGTQVRCHRLEEQESEIPIALKEMYKCYQGGNFKEAKGIANRIASKNRQLGLPGLDEEIRVLFKKIKEKRSQTKNTLYA